MRVSSLMACGIGDCPVPIGVEASFTCGKNAYHYSNQSIATVDLITRTIESADADPNYAEHPDKWENILTPRYSLAVHCAIHCVSSPTLVSKDGSRTRPSGLLEQLKAGSRQPLDEAGKQAFREYFAGEVQESRISAMCDLWNNPEGMSLIEQEPALRGFLMSVALAIGFGSEGTSTR